MKNYKKLLYNSTFILAVLSTVFLAYNMTVVPIYKEHIFFEREILSGVEVVILIGFGLILLFDILSLSWVLLRLRQSEKINKIDRVIISLGTICLIFLIGEKAMIDEIGREYMLGWEVLGEWVILYVFLTTQLVYNFVILLQLFNDYRVHLSIHNVSGDTR